MYYFLGEASPTNIKSKRFSLVHFSDIAMESQVVPSGGHCEIPVAVNPLLDYCKVLFTAQ